MLKLPVSFVTVAALATLSSTAVAAEPSGAAAEGSVSLSPAGVTGEGSAAGDGSSAAPAGDGAAAGAASGGAAAPAAAEKRGKKARQAGTEPWIKRHRPTRNQLELGIYGGVMLPAKDHELYNITVPGVMWQQYGKLAADIGLRVGYYPLSFLGLEIEGGVAPTKTAMDGSRALLGMFRGYGLLQLPYRVAPFALFGAGLIGTSGLGRDVDPALHFGGGVKFYATDLIALRLDVRDNLTAQYQAAAGRTHHLEILLGLSIVLGKKKPAPAPEPDSDGDGFKDSVDKCPQVAGVAPDGCPPPAEVPDSDGDGFKDDVDQCVETPGVAPDGCPEPDSDGDGFVDSKDTCPQVPGVAPDGCPPPDRDGDGIPDASDKCPDVPETRNNYQDDDGCADDVPKEVTKFTGVIKGIFFDVDKDTIKPASKKTLDNAVKVLKDFPTVKVEISGHTDSDGDHDHNVDLSRRRAEAVKKYLVDKGLDGSRITTRGAGPDEPIADNKTAKGKSQNRRIEFKLIQ